MQNQSNLTFKIFWNHITPWWKSEEKILAWFSIIGLVLISLISVYIAVIFNEWGKNFFNSLEQKNLDEFLHQVILFIPLVIILLAEFCTRNYLTSWVSFRWRKWATAEIQKIWLRNKNFYRLPLEFQVIDNPDQRIAQDISNISYQSMSLFMSFFREGINFITFSIILWQLSSQLVFNIAGHKLNIPGALVWASILYSLIGIIITFKIGYPLINLDKIQEKMEANFRYRLMRIFERREEIAILSGEIYENSRLKESFADITKNYYMILKNTIYINLFQNFYINGSMFVPLFLVGPHYFSGILTLGTLMQIRGMFSEINSSLLEIMIKYTAIANLIASTKRIVDFSAYMNLKEDKQTTSFNNKIHISNLIINSPKGDIMWKVPEITIAEGEKVLLMAPSGRGKTTLLRIIAGIYPYYNKEKSAEIILPNEIMFIPQRLYMPLGTLKQVLCYPKEEHNEEELIEIMKICKLDHLIPKLNINHDYQQILSLGEQQRVNFVRVLLHKPKWLLLDEPISHLNQSYVNDLCKVLKEKLKDSAILAITHQELPYFDRIIRMD